MSRPILAKHGFEYLTTLYDYEYLTPSLPSYRGRYFGKSSEVEIRIWFGP